MHTLTPVYTSQSHKMTALATQNAHVRDADIKFYSQGHKYEIATDGRSRYTSVTTWVHTMFAKFDGPKIIENMMNGKNWVPGHKYWGMSAGEITQLWKTAGIEASVAGTKLHAQIEAFMNNEGLGGQYTHQQLADAYTNANANTNFGECAKEWNYFIQFVHETPHMKPYRTEWMVYDTEYKIAGSIDMVYENADGTLSIYDWKRAKDIQRVSDWNKVSTNPLIADVPDTNYWHYALQLNVYRFILEKNYGKTVSKLNLVRLHPNNEYETYELIDVPLMETEMRTLFAERALVLAKNA